jgi:hypothetical protein
MGPEPRQSRMTSLTAFQAGKHFPAPHASLSRAHGYRLSVKITLTVVSTSIGSPFSR